MRCEAGRRVFAQYGDDADELWWRATILKVVRDDVGQWCDVRYDDGDEEERKPIKRVRAIDSDSESDDDDDDDDEEEEEEEEEQQEEEEEVVEEEKTRANARRRARPRQPK